VVNVIIPINKAETSPKQGYAAEICSRDMQQRYAAEICSRDMQRGVAQEPHDFVGC
jgi:hypothetical protein